jgi:O-antigen ligase
MPLWPKARSSGEVLSPQRARAIADALAIAAAASLPWSTSATGILIGVWLLSLLPVIKPESLLREIMTPAGGAPILLWLFAATGMLWADVGWTERLEGMKGFHKLLVIPLLLAQFRGSDKGGWAFTAFLASCTLLLISSFFSWSLNWRWGSSPGVPVKDYIAQSGEFALCAFALLPLTMAVFRAGRRSLALCLGVLAVLFLVNVGFIATGRTTLVVIAVLVVLFALRNFGWKGGTVVLLLGLASMILVWAASPYLRTEVSNVREEIERYTRENVSTRSGERLEYWRKSVQFVAEAPVFGHGTGSIPELFRRSAVGQTGVSALASVNPHNQTLVAAIQLGVAGAVLLYGMWIAHLLLFRGPGLPEWIGLIVVVQNVVASVFNSHLSDFTQGWIYVFGVGIAGGTVLRRGSRSISSSTQASANAASLM